MPRTRIFGGVIAKALDSAFKSVSPALGGSMAASLVQFSPGTRTGGDVINGTQPTSTTYAVRAFRDRGSRFYAAQMNAWIEVDVISIFGESLPSGVVPKVGDSILFESRTRKVIAVDTDPDGALYSCKVQ
jgi:hypothetical protein